jgi:Uma2 family endonuclease
MNVALKPMSREEFFDWAQRQDLPYEFDGFRPVLMTRGNLGHSRIMRNISYQLTMRLAGKPCEPFGPEAGVGTVGQAVRYPDAVVTCSTFSDRDYLVPDPVIVFEVVSPTSIRTDRVIKLREYQAVPSIRRYVIVEPTACAITVFSREHADAAFAAAGLADGDVLHLPEIDIEIPVADIYEGFDFPNDVP